MQNTQVMSQAFFSPMTLCTRDPVAAAAAAQGESKVVIWVLVCCSATRPVSHTHSLLHERPFRRLAPIIIVSCVER